MFKVIVEFSDLQHKKHIYRVGDEYPHSDYSVSEERLNELLTCRNRLKTPLIELVEDKSEDAENPAKVAEKLEENPAEEPTEKPKRRRRKKQEE